MELYFAPLACSMATRIVLDEIGRDATFTEVDTREKRILAHGGDFLAVNPLGQVPVLRTDDGVLLTENAAILQYVARLAPEAGLLGADRDLPQLQEWLSFIGAELHKGVFTALLSSKSSEETKAAARKTAEPRLAVLDGRLAGREHLLDRFTVADAYLATVLNWSRASALDLGRWPNVTAYHARMLSRPSLARAVRLERGLYAAELARLAA